MRRLLLVATIGLLLVPAASSSRSSGLFGQVMRGPVTPVCHAGTPCSRPAAGLTLEFLRAGVVRGQVTTAADGTYRIALAPGLYTLRGTMRLQPLKATVLAGTWTRLAVSIDTGIR